MKRLVFLLCCTCLVSSLFAAPPSLEELRQRVTQEKARLQRLEERERLYDRKVQQMEQEASSLLATLERFDRRLQRLQQELRLLEAQLALHQAEREKLQQQQEQLRAQLAARRQLLRQRVRALYRQGTTSYLHLLFSSTSLSALQTRLHALQRIAAYDAQLLRSYTETLQTLRQQEEVLAQKMVAITAQKRAQEAKQQQMAREKLQKRRLLATIRKEKQTYMRLRKEIRTATAQVSRLIASLERQQQALVESNTRRIPQKEGEKRFPLLKGVLRWPVQGEVIARYGTQKHPEFKTPIVHKGITIRAAPGSAIRAVAPGAVIYADWFKGYGQLVIIDHGESYYSLYAYLADLKVKPGDRVSSAQIIGTVGEGISHESALYFEIRHHGNSEDPMAWLMAKPQG
ncbi:MAG: hypothetical protein D6736_12450 [Nitrospinota bacterium]|nr:MAG: hypothetical protein D6736_12450 [Nitrospinota bacterium]